MQQFRGILDWPAAGKVVERFGPRLDPRYHTQVPHNGVDLETTAGGEVKAVYPGKVLFAAPFEGYGLTVVVHHPGRVLTLYAGLSELRKAKDDMVSLAEIVGLAADRLYFEIRVENHPEDPVSWLH
jgi:septal ring factor EnvC (AmiA/AmiB activator)